MIKDKIESKHNVLGVSWNKAHLWPLFKPYIYNSINTYSSVAPSKNLGLLKRVFSKFLISVKSIIKIKKTEAFILSNSNRRITINGQSFARISQGVYDHFNGKAVFIESNINVSHDDVERGTNFINETLILPLQALLILLFKLIQPKFQGKSILVDILNEYNVNVNIDFRFYKFLARYYTFKWLLKIHKPKYVFVECYYDYCGYIKACKDENVQVIELQHGMIAESHRSYNYGVSVNNHLLPDKLLTFGFRESELYNNTDVNFIDKECVLPTGFYLFDLFRKGEVQSPKELSMVIDADRPSFIISGQDLIEEKSIPFINQLAILRQDCDFIYVPRTKTTSYETLFTQPNIKVVNKFPIYQVINATTAHITAFSTTALESLAMGKVNVFMNIDGLSEKHFENYLSFKGVYIINSPEDFTIQMTDQFKNHKPEELSDLMKEEYLSNYLTNLTNHLTGN
ncbi:hypothetical protein JCM19294_527 [Nonlabens tegetincola]|uniref:Uncharacterized protein n=1 Tax=Nonlabens tegetincola TaxID=323273 RepID=A0A090QNG8_9FLAO|nr:hypothetical protein [Nonlabens tegetincola]GAK97021.1 hypothetical protein JCM19294_527 [Nonlabens tegetincola]